MTVTGSTCAAARWARRSPGHQDQPVIGMRSTRAGSLAMLTLEFLINYQTAEPSEQADSNSNTSRKPSKRTLRHRNRLLGGLASVLLITGVIAGCTGSRSVDKASNVQPGVTSTPSVAPSATPKVSSTPTAATKPLPPFADPQKSGNYAVGRRTFTVTDPTRQRTLTVDAWYPAPLASAKGKPLSRYEVVPGLGYPSHMAYDDLPAAAGRYPIVLFSHGKPTIRFQSSFLMEALASYGFVVLAPDHPGSTGLNDYLPVSTDLIERSKDLSFLLDQVAAGAGGLGATVDMTEVAASGHSLGAYTAMALPIGADPGVPADTRIKAVVAMTPTTSYLTDTQMRSIRIPTLLLGGTQDDLTPLNPNLTRPMQLISGRPLIRVDLVGATHRAFIETCNIPGLLSNLRAGLTNIEQFEINNCLIGSLPVETAHHIVDLYTVAFLKSTLVGDHRYDRYLSANAAKLLPEINYYLG